MIKNNCLSKVKTKSHIRKNFLTLLLEGEYDDSLIQAALTKGTDPNDVIPGTDSPLTAAVRVSRFTTICTLLEAGASVAYKDENDLSAFDIFAGELIFHIFKRKPFLSKFFDLK